MVKTETATEQPSATFCFPLEGEVTIDARIDAGVDVVAKGEDASGLVQNSLVDDSAASQTGLHKGRIAA